MLSPPTRRCMCTISVIPPVVPAGLVKEALKPPSGKQNFCGLGTAAEAPADYPEEGTSFCAFVLHRCTLCCHDDPTSLCVGRSLFSASASAVGPGGAGEGEAAKRGDIVTIALVPAGAPPATCSYAAWESVCGAYLAAYVAPCACACCWCISSSRPAWPQPCWSSVAILACFCALLCYGKSHASW